jgi:3-dehydroquinate dehydratase / shikimate dehydrogenase
MDKACLIGTLTAPPSPDGDDLRALPRDVEWLEVRADLIGDLDPDWIRGHFDGRLLFTLRSADESGRFAGSAGERRERLARAARHYDLVDLEADRDLSPDLLEAVPAAQRLISWTGQAADASDLRGRVERLTSCGARLYRLEPAAAINSDGIAPLQALSACRRRDVIAFATGEAGFWTRLLAPYFGAPVVFGAIGSRQRSLSEPTIAQLVDDYGLPALPPLRDLYGIVGNPVAHSLSPQLHNTAYRALGLPGLFLPFQDSSFDDFWRRMVQPEPLQALGAAFRGLTVASPHKEAALRAAASGSAMVQRAGATNIFVRNGHGWKADTTDPEGAVVALREHGIVVNRQKAAVIGCGGAGRAVAAALDEMGADVTLVNRSQDRGVRAQSLLGLPFVALSQFSPDDYSMVVNATPVGRDGDALPFDLRRMRSGGSVIDLTYGRDATPLIRQALALGLTAIAGLEVLFIQVRRQFRLMTGSEMPRDLLRERLGLPVRELAVAR